MAHIVIETTREEQQCVFKAIEQHEDKVISIANLADWSGLNQSRTRYALMDLVDQGIIEKVPAKAFNKNYIRYMYKVVRK